MVDNMRFVIALIMFLIPFSIIKGQVNPSENMVEQEQNQQEGTTVDDYKKIALPMPMLAKVLRESSCRLGAINEKGGGVLIKDDNVFAHTKEIPVSMLQVLNGVKEDKGIVRDIVLTNNGCWCVVWGKNSSYGYTSMQFSSRLEKIRENDEAILSIAYNDNHEWIVVTDKNCYTSSDKYARFLKDAENIYGFVSSVSITNTAMVACCQKGVYYENIPKKVLEVLQQSNFIPKVIKFTDSGTCLITNGVSECVYWL